MNFNLIQETMILLNHVVKFSEKLRKQVPGTQGETTCREAKILKISSLGETPNSLMILNHVEKFHENRLKNGGDRYTRFKLLTEEQKIT